MRRFLSSCLGILILSATGCASRTTSLQTRLSTEPVALWLEGAGTLDKKPASAGDTILPGTKIEAGPDHAVSLDLSAEYDCELALAPGAAATLRVVAGSRPESPQLIVQLDRGRIEMRLRDATYYEDIRIVGSVLEMHATNARFLAERVERDADYVAVIRGNVVANLRPTLANALHQPEGIQLQSRQGLAANAASGFAAIDQLNHRPLLQAPAATGAGLQEQCMSASTGENGKDEWVAPETALPPAVISEEPAANADIAAPEATSDLAGQSQQEPGKTAP